MTSRWKKGQSGNPKGRPRKAKDSLDVKNALKKLLGQSVKITQGGNTSTATMLEAGLGQMVMQFGRGDARARRDLFAIADKVGLPLVDELNPAEGTSVEGRQKILADFVTRFVGSHQKREFATIELLDDDRTNEGDR